MVLRKGTALCCTLLIAGIIFAHAARPLYQDAGSSIHSEEKLNLRPLIGIVSQGGQPAPKHSSYISASYVKFAEAAGARVVPILHDMSPEEVTRRFNAVNGIIIPGGSQDLHSGNPYFDTAALVFDLTVKANDNGDYFPVSKLLISYAFTHFNNINLW